MLLKKQIVINLATNILAMAIAMLISIFVTPYLINHLGLAAYGYVGLIANLINFMAVITYTLNSMVARFLTVSMKKEGSQAASNYMSSALFSNLFIGGLLLPIFVVLSLNLDKLIKIGSELAFDVKLAFFLEVLAFILTSISAIFLAGAYSRNRLDINNGIIILSNVCRILVILGMFSLFRAQIWHYSLGSIVQVAITVALGIFAFRYLLPEVQFRLKLFNFKMSWELLSSGFFNSIILLGNNFLSQIDLLVGNRFLPAETVGMYAAILLIPNTIRNIASALSFAFSPTTVALYSSGDMDELRRYTNKVVKFCGLLIGWPVAIITALAIPILKLWLGRDYSAYEGTIILMLVPLALNLSVNQLYIVQQATNKVKIPAIAAIVFGGLNVALALFFAGVLKMGIFGIVLSGVIMSTLRLSVFVPIYTAIITDQPKLVYYKGMIAPIVVTIAISGIGLLFQKVIGIWNFLPILATSLGLTLLYMPASLLVLNREERQSVFQKIGSLLRRPVPNSQG